MALLFDPLVEHVRWLNNQLSRSPIMEISLGTIPFYTKARSAGIKPIIGAKSTWPGQSVEQKTPEGPRDFYHLILLAQNSIGYHNLIPPGQSRGTRRVLLQTRIDRSLLRSLVLA